MQVHVVFSYWYRVPTWFFLYIYSQPQALPDFLLYMFHHLPHFCDIFVARVKTAWNRLQIVFFSIYTSTNVFPLLSGKARESASRCVLTALSLFTFPCDVHVLCRVQVSSLCYQAYHTSQQDFFPSTYIVNVLQHFVLIVRSGIHLNISQNNLTQVSGPCF